MLLPLFILLTGVHSSWALQGTRDPSETIDDKVWKVVIEGNETFSDIVVKQTIATAAPSFWRKLAFWNERGDAVNELELQRDVIRISRFYQRRGFIHVQVNYRVETGSRDWKKVIYFEIDENAPVRIGSLTYSFDSSEPAREMITGTTAFRRAQQRHAFQVGNRYETIAEPGVIGRFGDLLKNLGFAFAEVEIDASVDSTRNTASINILLRPGPTAYFGTVNVQGAETVSDDYIIREAEIREGDRFSQNQLQQAQRELFNHHLFRFAIVNIPEQEQDSSLAINITIREYALRSVQAQVGFGTEDILRGQLGWTHRNVLGKGHRFTASGRASFIEQSVNVDYLFPYIFNTKSSIVISPFVQHILERRIFELFHGGITNSFIYRYSNDLTGTASYQITRNLELTQETEDVLPDTTFEYDLSSFQLSAYYSPGFSNRGEQGWVIQPYAEFSGLFGAAAYSFQKYSIDVRRFSRLTNSTTLATRVQAGAIYNVAQDSLPQNTRYYLGGTSSVRGWNRNELGPKRARFDSTGSFIDYAPTGGRFLFGFNAEIRQQLNSLIRGFGIAIFLDGGQVWGAPGDIDERPIQYGVGGGLRYESPIGPVRVDVGYKINPTDEDLNRYGGTDYGGPWDRIGIHFTIGQAF